MTPTASFSIGMNLPARFTASYPSVVRLPAADLTVSFDRTGRRRHRWSQHPTSRRVHTLRFSRCLPVTPAAPTPLLKQTTSPLLRFLHSVPQVEIIEWCRRLHQRRQSRTLVHRANGPTPHSMADQ